MKSLYTSKDLSLDSNLNHTIGGKAKALLGLHGTDWTIPRWAVIPVEVFEQTSGQNLSNLNHEVKTYFGSGAEEKLYAVRSSAVGEDGSHHSYAGQFTTRLAVPFDQLQSAITEVRLSTQSDHVKTYQSALDITHEIQMAVIIQEMILAESAGVAFGANPMSGDTNHKTITSVWGLGEGLVSGLLEADTFTQVNDKVTSQIATKTQRTQSDPINGIITQKLHDNIQNQPSLTDDQVSKVFDLLDSVHSVFGMPQDVEFCWQAGTLYLLQSRPITSLDPSQRGEYTLWDNSNIIESYPGITTPLTYSFILKMYESVYVQFVKLLGVKQSVIDQHQEIFANTLGLIRGRVYYNLLNWYKMLSMLPGYSLNAEFMEDMMGVKERFDLKETFQMSKFQATWRMIRLIVTIVIQHIKLPAERRKFDTHVNSVIQEYTALNLDTLSAKEIIGKYRHFEQTLLLKWQAPLTNDFFAMIWFGILQKMTTKLAPESPNLHNALLCGSSDIISVEPIRLLIDLSRSISSDEAVKHWFITHSPEQVWSQFMSGHLPQVNDQIQYYLDTFGDRCVGELKLETRSYSQYPESLIAILQSYVKNGITSQSSNTIEQEIRNEAEDTLKLALKGKPLKRLLLGKVTAMARSLVSNRENLRYQRTRGFGMVRKLMVALGKRWADDGQLATHTDVFYLELDEILNSDGSLDPTLLETIEARKSEFDTYRHQEKPQERFYTYGSDYSDAYIYSTEKLTVHPSDQLVGIGCCPGRVKGRVRVVDDPTQIQSLDGDILVTSSTDPGWVTLFPTVSAIIVERGSLLSHSAIVSREMGIPCIVGVTGLLSTLQTGDVIWMDGSTGTITRVEQG